MAERKVTFDELRALIERLGDRLPAVVRPAVVASSQAMLRDVVLNRMSGQYLGVVTGTGRRSMEARVAEAANRLSASISNPLGYIRAHEEGFKGPVSVRAHTRRLKARGRAGKKKAATVAHVRAHTRVANIRARHFMRDTVLQEAGRLPSAGTGVAPIERRVVRALEIFLVRNRPARAGELGV